MKLIIYKGFNTSFYNDIEERPLVEGDLAEKINVLEYDRNTRKKLERALLDLEDTDTVWVLYEEYTLIRNRVEEAKEQDGLIISVVKNNLLPDFYPLEFEVSDDLAYEIDLALDGKSTSQPSEQCRKYLEIYNSFIQIDGVYYGSFFNFEFENGKDYSVINYYTKGQLKDDYSDTNYNIYLNEDIETYLRDLAYITAVKPEILGIRSTGGEISNRILDSLLAFCLKNNIRATKYHEIISQDIVQENELKRISKEELGIKAFQDFRNLRFYDNPDISKDTVEISQGQLIREIITQAEKSYNSESGEAYRDIFITAPTGAGKSLMFQIPAVYLTQKYNKLTIIIEPVKALMQDQKEKLYNNGYTRVEAFNSDLITQVEKEAVLEKIKSGRVDLLYLSPETLLSYSIETIIGDREIGLLIIDEAHIVTTWGVGFRPDYWYLGGYINRLRNQIKTGKNYNRKLYHFPVCAFTATAINGGLDDTIGETITSLYMENPIKYIGYTKRDDIYFDIEIKADKKLTKEEYEKQKTAAMSERLNEWIKYREKTIVYFPYASLAGEAKAGSKRFAGIKTHPAIGIYTGRNLNNSSAEYFKEEKKEVFDKFRTGECPVVYATKAFGMGIDINNIKNVYHYAVSGNLSDYVQEIGRAARKETMTGWAVTDYFENDMTYMKVLFGISAIRQYQVKKVLEGIYQTYQNKHYSRSFLISPESFTYIFGGDDSSCISQLKTTLLMLEKDFFDKYNFKVLISRPQSVFTRSYVVVDRDHADEVLRSKYGKYFSFIQKGRKNEIREDGVLISDKGDIYLLDLKSIWEEFNQNISFPQFKYWYFNNQFAARDKVEIMPEIRDYIGIRQKLTIEANNDLLFCDIRDKIFEDFEYIGNLLYSNFRNTYFTIDDFAKLISEKYGMTVARMISNSLFDLVDPNSTCIKHRTNEATGKTVYSISNGNFKEIMRRPITKSQIVRNISYEHSDSYSAYVSMGNEKWSEISLKLLSVFGYITYEISGGEEPEIFIRLNDPNKVKGIVNGTIYYSNGYVTRASQKHKRDVEVMSHFFKDIETTADRWNYIEDYFLGYDVLSDKRDNDLSVVEMRKTIDKDHSYTTSSFKKWAEMYCFFDETDHPFIKKLEETGVPKPEYLETIIKKSELGDDILMSWPSKNTLICHHETSDSVMRNYATMGWNAYRISDIDYIKIAKELS